MTDQHWRRLEAIAERLKRAAQKYHDDQMLSDAEYMSAEAARQRQLYVNWLWGFG